MYSEGNGQVMQCSSVYHSVLDEMNGRFNPYYLLRQCEKKKTEEGNVLRERGIRRLETVQIYEKYKDF